MRTVNYEKKYFNGIAKLMSEYWDYDKYFPHSKKPIYIYKLLLCDIVNNLDYSVIVVDEDDQVMGCILGKFNNEKKSLKKIFNLFKFLIKLEYYILFNLLGKKISSIKTILSILYVFNILKKDENKFDSNIELFILKEELRGMGLGRALMDDYMDYCARQNLNSVHLCTDKTSNYKFYEKYGFTLYDRVLFDPNSDPDKDTGLIYTYKIV